MVSGSVPGGKFCLQGWKITDASVEALFSKGGEFDFSHVEPGTMFWGVVNFQTTEKASCFVWFKSFVESCRLVGIEVVAYQYNFFGVCARAHQADF